MAAWPSDGTNCELPNPPAQNTSHAETLEVADVELGWMYFDLAARELCLHHGPVLQGSPAPRETRKNLPIAPAKQKPTKRQLTAQPQRKRWDPGPVLCIDHPQSPSGDVVVLGHPVHVCPLGDIFDIIRLGHCNRCKWYVEARGLTRLEQQVAVLQANPTSATTTHFSGHKKSKFDIDQ